MADACYQRATGGEEQSLGPGLDIFRTSTRHSKPFGGFTEAIVDMEV